MGPGEALGRLPVDVRHAVLQPSVVEGRRGEFGHQGMHTILRVQEARPANRGALHGLRVRLTPCVTRRVNKDSPRFSVSATSERTSKKIFL